MAWPSECENPFHHPRQPLGLSHLRAIGSSAMAKGYNESFNGKLRDEVLNREVFDTLQEAKVLVERWRHEYNHIRPHSALGYRPPAPEVIVPADIADLPLWPGVATLRQPKGAARLT